MRYGEGHEYHVLSSRMSILAMGWSRRGGSQMARLREYYYNGANVKHFFTPLGNDFFTLYGNQIFTLYGKEIFTLFGKEFFTWYGKQFFTSPYSLLP